MVSSPTLEQEGGRESWLAWWETPSGGQMSGQGPALPLTKQLGDLTRVVSAFWAPFFRLEMKPGVPQVSSAPLF